MFYAGKGFRNGQNIRLKSIYHIAVSSMNYFLLTARASTTIFSCKVNDNPHLFGQQGCGGSVECEDVHNAGECEHPVDGEEGEAGGGGGAGLEVGGEDSEDDAEPRQHQLADPRTRQ